MFEKNNISRKQSMLVILILTMMVLGIYWPVQDYGFINFDDDVYVTQNINVQSDITCDGLRWAFSTKIFRVMESLDMAVPDVGLSTFWLECRRLSLDQCYFPYSEFRFIIFLFKNLTALSGAALWLPLSLPFIR